MKNSKIKYFTFWSSIFTLLFMTACATTHEILAHRKNNIVANVPFYPQERYQCGPASLAGVLNYWNINITPDEIAKEMYSESAKGVLNIDLVIYAQKKRLIAEQYPGGIDDIKRNINYGYPLIVLVGYGFSIFQVNHFMVVIGYNEDGVVVNSGKEEKRFIPSEEFIRIWERTKFWTLLIKKSEYRTQNTERR